LEAHRFFSTFDKRFLYLIRSKCRPLVYFPGELIMKQGDVADSLFIFGNDSNITLQVDNVNMRDLLGRACLGVVALLSVSPIRRTSTVICNTVCSVRNVTREDWQDALKSYPEHRFWIQAFTEDQMKNVQGEHERFTRRKICRKVAERENQARKFHEERILRRNQTGAVDELDAGSSRQSAPGNNQKAVTRSWQQAGNEDSLKIEDEETPKPKTIASSPKKLAAAKKEMEMRKTVIAQDIFGGRVPKKTVGLGFDEAPKDVARNEVKERFHEAPQPLTPLALGKGRYNAFGGVKSDRGSPGSTPRASPSSAGVQALRKAMNATKRTSVAKTVTDVVALLRKTQDVEKSNDDDWGTSLPRRSIAKTDPHLSQQVALRGGVPQELTTSYLPVSTVFLPSKQLQQSAMRPPQLVAAGRGKCGPVLTLASIRGGGGLLPELNLLSERQHQSPVAPMPPMPQSARTKTAEEREPSREWSRVARDASGHAAHSGTNVQKEKFQIVQKNHLSAVRTEENCNGGDLWRCFNIEMTRMPDLSVPQLGQLGGISKNDQNTALSRYMERREGLDPQDRDLDDNASICWSEVEDIFGEIERDRSVKN